MEQGTIAMCETFLIKTCLFSKMFNFSISLLHFTLSILYPSLWNYSREGNKGEGVEFSEKVLGEIPKNVE